jgi:hypothetical protein
MLAFEASNYNLNKNNQLCVRSPDNRSDFVVVFYKGSRCNLCYNLLPGFSQVQNKVRGCTFATVDLTDPDNVSLRHMALRSTTPLNKVPQIILYFKDIPVSEYQLAGRMANLPNLNSFMEDLKSWVINVASEIHNKVKNNDLVFTEEGDTCIGDRCELSIPSSKPTPKRYKKL